ncbi:MAG: hypothetical protein ACPG1C_10225 [Alphaproteobacteria bacterium]
MNNLFKVFVVVALGLTASMANARQFRDFQPIGNAAPLPANAVEVVEPRPVKRLLIEAAVRQIFRAWNDRTFGDLLSENYEDRQQLLLTLRATVPRNARLNVVAIRNHVLVRQYLQKNEDGTIDQVSIVEATVDSQLVFEHASQGLVRQIGSNEFLLQVKEPRS